MLSIFTTNCLNHTAEVKAVERKRKLHTLNVMYPYHAFCTACVGTGVA